MDNLTHSLLGAAIAKTPLGRASPLAPLAFVVAANLPDFENFVLAFYDQPTNMLHHRSITHGVVGVAVLAPLFTLLVWAADRRLARGSPRRSWWPLLGGVTLAAWSHPLLDWLNTYGVRPWLPFDWTWYQGDLVFIIDPWLWLLLGAAVCLAGPRRWWGSVLLAVVGLAATAAVLLAPLPTPAALPVVWLVAVVLLGWGRWRRIGSTRPGTVVATALGLAVVYVGLLGVAGRTAWRQSVPIITARLSPGERIVARTLSPQPADPFRWQVIAETHDAIYRHTFSILVGPGGVQRLARRVDDPHVLRLAGSPEYRAWQGFSRHPVAAVATNGGGRRVFLLDARYPLLPAPRFSSQAVDVPP